VVRANSSDEAGQAIAWFPLVRKQAREASARLSPVGMDPISGRSASRPRAGSLPARISPVTFQSAKLRLGIRRFKRELFPAETVNRLAVERRSAADRWRESCPQRRSMHSGLPVGSGAAGPMNLRA
jgi:hypothetical protein